MAVLLLVKTDVTMAIPPMVNLTRSVYPVLLNVKLARMVLQMNASLALLLTHSELLALIDAMTNVDMATMHQVTQPVLSARTHALTVTVHHVIVRLVTHRAVSLLYSITIVLSLVLLVMPLSLAFAMLARPLV